MRAPTVSDRNWRLVDAENKVTIVSHHPGTGQIIVSGPKGQLTVPPSILRELGSMLVELADDIAAKKEAKS